MICTATGTTDADRALFCAYLSEIVNIQTLDDLRSYLASDACRDHGATLLSVVLDGHDMSLSGLEST